MGNRHKFKKGGMVAYAGGDSNVAKEAKEKKSGGKVTGSVAGAKGKSRIKKAGGGSCDASPYSSAHRG